MDQTSSTIVLYTVWGSKGAEGVGRGMASEAAGIAREELFPMILLQQ